MDTKHALVRRRDLIVTGKLLLMMGSWDFGGHGRIALVSSWRRNFVEEGPFVIVHCKVFGVVKSSAGADERE